MGGQRTLSNISIVPEKSLTFLDIHSKTLNSLLAIATKPSPNNHFVFSWCMFFPCSSPDPFYPLYLHAANNRGVMYQEPVDQGHIVIGSQKSVEDDVEKDPK